MGLPEDVDGGVGAGWGVGAIVWVRRRNGSWWPGRILGQEELSASHVMSPRSGTPVKLLGREDASVDWYNLEKSKRVKPFRCGEFDACIERAEASHGVPIKKREKYARREDAIIHALELEKQYLERQQQKYGTNSNALSHKYFGNLKKMMNSCPSSGLQLRDNEPMDHSEPVNSELQSQTGRVDWPAEGLEGIPVHVQMGKHSKQMNWEDRNSTLLPFTRGLQDFGLHMASSKRKQPSSAPCESSQPALFDNHVDDIPDSRHSIEGVNDTGGVKNSMGIKRKRLHGTLMEESPIKRRDMHRPFVQVLQNGIKLPAKSLQGNFEGTSDVGKDKKEQIGVAYDASSSDHCNHTGHSSDQMQMSSTESGYSNHVHQPGPLAGEDASSVLIGEGETSSSEGDYLVADLDEETALNEDAKSFIHGSRNLEGHASKGVSVLGDQEKLEKMSDEYDMLLSDHEVHIVSKDWAAGTDDIGLSKWHMKGKRNIRNLARKSMEAFDGKDSVMSSDNYCGSLNGSVERKRCSFKTGWEGLSGQGLYHKDDKLNYVYEDDDVFEKDNRLIGFGNHSYPLMLKAASRDHIIHGINDSDEDSHKIFPSVWEEADEPPHLAQSYWGESDEFLDAHFIHPVNIDMAPRLVDVNLKVQASCQRREHVPLVSLMSRLNGKAIIGHPVHIEILEDGSTDFLCPRNHLGVNATAVDELAAPTAWRTGKRTAMQRVPRAHLVKSLQGEESEFIPYSNGEGRPPFKKSFPAPTSWTSVMKSSSHHKFHKKPSKKRSLPSQKSRTLYTIAMKKWDHVNASAKHWRKEGSILDGLIKPSSVVSLVTCVPVKVVFTRILEVVGGPPSASMAHGASTG